MLWVVSSVIFYRNWKEEEIFKFVVVLGIFIRMGCGGEFFSGREYGVWGSGRSLIEVKFRKECERGL